MVTSLNLSIGIRDGAKSKNQLGVKMIVTPLQRGKGKSKPNQLQNTARHVLSK
jgi:hypothetical protein